MKNKRRILIYLSLSTLIFFSLSTLAVGQANVSRSPNWRSVSPRMDVDSTGNIHVVWAEYYGGMSGTIGDAFYCMYDAGAQVWRTPVNLSNSNMVYTSEFRPVGIDIDGSDRIYVAYVENAGTTHRLRLRIYSGGSWSSSFEVGSASDEVDSARLAVDSAGNIFTCWWTVNQGNVYSRARIGGTWEGLRTISPRGARAKFCNIAVGNNVVFCTWQELRTEGYRAVCVRRDKSSGAAWTSSQPVSSDVACSNPDVEIDGNDVAHFVYTPALAAGGNRRVIYVRSTANGFTSPLALSGVTLLHYASIYVRGNNIYVCWQIGAWGFGTAVNYNNRINGSWTGQGPVPNSDGCTLTDVATSPSQSEVYYVWDDMGRSGTWEIYCNMGQTGPPPPPPDSPVALFSYSPTSGAPPLTVNFDGSASYDPNGTITAYSWNFGDGASASGAVVNHTYNSAGVFTARLTVTDNDGKTGSTYHNVNVTGSTTPNERPIAQFSFSPSTGLYPLQVTFNGSASRDPDGRIVQYNWDFGDGLTASGRVVTHTYTRYGTFLIRLTVRDDRGATGTISKMIKVLTLLKPLNISWSTRSDESLFQIRYVTDITWERNPANDALGAQIVLYRIYRKLATQGDSAYRTIGEVTGDTYRYLDKNAGASNTNAYTVTAIDNGGHESPIVVATSFFNNSLLDQGVKNAGKKDKVLKF
jgi:PKD repeat protein